MALRRGQVERASGSVEESVDFGPASCGTFQHRQCSIYIPLSVVSGSSPSLSVTFYQYTIYLEMFEMLSHCV